MCEDNDPKIAPNLFIFHFPNSTAAQVVATQNISAPAHLLLVLSLVCLLHGMVAYTLEGDNTRSHGDCGACCYYNTGKIKF